MTGTQYQANGPTAVIAMNDPPVSEPDHATRGDLVAALDRAQGV